MDKRFSLIIIAAVVVIMGVVLISGCTSPTPTATPTVAPTAGPTAKPTPGNYTITAFDSADPRGLDPANDYESVGIGIIQNVYETLLYYDGTSMTKMAPVLATAYNVSDDGMTYTFCLRNGVKFHDGTTFNSSFVKYSFERGVIMNQLTWKYMISQFVKGGLNYSKSNHTEADIAAFKALDTFHIVNDSCIQIKLENPYPAFPQLMAFSGASIVSPEFVEAHGGYKPLNRTENSYLYDHDAGSGPYMIDSWTRNDKTVMKRFDNYWQGAAPAAQVIIKVVPDVNQRMLALQTGEADIAAIQSMFDPQVRNITNVDVLVTNESISLDYIALNYGIPPFDNKLVRQAFVESFDYNTYINKVFNGYGVHTNGPIPTGMTGYNAQLPEQKFNPEHAKQLLQQAGYSKSSPKTITIYSNSNNEGRQTLALMLKQQIESYDVGLTIDVQDLEWSVLLDKTEKAELPIFILGWIGDYPDADNFLNAICYSQGYCAYESNFANATVDDLYLKQQTELNPAKRQQYIDQLVQTVNDEAAFIWLRQAPSYQPHRVELKGVVHNPVDSNWMFYPMYK